MTIVKKINGITVVSGTLQNTAADVTYSNATSGLTATNVQTAIDEVSAYVKGYINGGVISNDGTTPDEIIDLTAVVCRSSDDTANISVASDSLDITTNADWASGTAPTLTSASIFAYATSSGYILDDATGSNIAGVKRRIGAFITDSSGDIIPFVAIENGQSIDLNYSTPISESGATHDLSVPAGIPLSVHILCQLGINRNGASYISSYIGDWAQIETAFTSGQWDGANSIKDDFPVSDSNRSIIIAGQSLSLLKNYGYIDWRVE